jgi:enoyl-CoA hydratase/carnithine racemase
MTSTTLTQQDGIHVLHLGDSENRFSPDWMVEVHDALDKIVANPAPLVTIAGGKNYSQGLDLEWVMAHQDQFEQYAARAEGLLARVLTLPVPTVAAVNGHAFGAGAMLAIAHDWRVMREDRGFFCFPEVDIQIPFTPGMASLIQHKVTRRTAVDSMTTGYRYPGSEALAAGLVDGTATEADLLGAAISRVAQLQGKHADTLGKIKAEMFGDPAAKLGSAR